MDNRKKILFIDRDGTLILEPQPDQQVDSLEKLEFLPGVLTNLAKIAAELDYELVMVTNQDGLGTPAFPEDTFWPPHLKMMKTLENEGIHFSAVHIDRSFPQEQLPTRKPGTAMLTAYMTDSYDLSNSFVIGDRLTDVQLAQNLGAKAILIRNASGREAALTLAGQMPEESRTQYDPAGLENQIACLADHWSEIYRFLALPPRTAEYRRTTRETDISVRINLDGSGNGDIKTGIGFFDHMLDQVARHGRIDLEIRATGDLHIDEHHTIEDTAISLGEAMLQALGSKIGLQRYGFCLPMDESLAQVAVDFGGRPWIVWNASFQREKIGDMPTEMFFHFFKSFSDAARCNLNIQVEGQNEHHKIEAIFKAFALAIRMAVQRDPRYRHLPSTKGLI